MKFWVIAEMPDDAVAAQQGLAPGTTILQSVSYHYGHLMNNSYEVSRNIRHLGRQSGQDSRPWSALLLAEQVYEDLEGLSGTYGNRHCRDVGCGGQGRLAAH